MQKNLFGESLDKEESVQFLKHQLERTKYNKTYKKCSNPNCEGDQFNKPSLILNKPCKKFCWKCLIEFSTSNDTVIPFRNPFVSCPRTNN